MDDFLLQTSIFCLGAQAIFCTKVQWAGNTTVPGERLVTSTLDGHCTLPQALRGIYKTIFLARGDGLWERGLDQTFA